MFFLTPYTDASQKEVGTNPQHNSTSNTIYCTSTEKLELHFTGGLNPTWPLKAGSYFVRLQPVGNTGREAPSQPERVLWEC